jgi:hypothetical protein
LLFQNLLKSPYFFSLKKKGTIRKTFFTQTVLTSPIFFIWLAPSPYFSNGPRYARRLPPSSMDSSRSQSLAPPCAGGMLSSSPPLADPVETRSAALSPLLRVCLLVPASAPSSPLPKKSALNLPARKVFHVADRACVG